MEVAKHQRLEELDLFRRYTAVARWAWISVAAWSSFARDTTGKQLVRAAGSIGANLVEGDARHRRADGLHFFVIARASARETECWVRLAIERELIRPADGEEQITELIAATRMLNALINYRRTHESPGVVKES